MRSEQQKAHTPLLITDADNTLWDTNAVFAHAQLSLLKRVEDTLGEKAPDMDRLGFIRTVDQNIAKAHHQHLKYPPRLLVVALALTLTGKPPAQAAKQAVRSSPELPPKLDPDGCAEWFFDQIKTGMPELRAGVYHGLQGLFEASIPVVVVTEGPEDKCKRLIAHYELSTYITKVFSAPKSKELFRRIIRLMRRREESSFVVGDQLDRDIEPAKQIGCTTIYFPGGFQPSWTPKEESVAPDYRISSFGEVPSIIITAPQSVQGEHHAVWEGEA